MKMKIFGLLCLYAGYILLFFWFFLLLHSGADAHETETFKHATKPIDHIVGIIPCSLGMSVWERDMDGDGVVDMCTAVIFNHDKLHIAPAQLELKDGKWNCTCKVAGGS